MRIIHALVPSQCRSQMNTGRAYQNIRTALFAIGTAMPFFAPLTAQAVPVTFVAAIGNFEMMPTGSPGTGSATVIMDVDANTLSIQASFQDLLGTTTAAHIHCCVAPPGNAGVATTTPSFPGFPLGHGAGSGRRLLPDVSYSEDALKGRREADFVFVGMVRKRRRARHRRGSRSRPVADCGSEWGDARACAVVTGLRAMIEAAAGD